MKDNDYDSIELTPEEIEEALHEAKVKKFFHEKAVKNGSFAIVHQDQQNDKQNIYN